MRRFQFAQQLVEFLALVALQRRAAETRGVEQLHGALKRRLELGVEAQRRGRRDFAESARLIVARAELHERLDQALFVGARAPERRCGFARGRHGPTRGPQQPDEHG